MANDPSLEQRRRPGLSATLEQRRDPRICQACGLPNSKTAPLSRWLEHDEWDRVPERDVRVVVLCAMCAKRLIDPHPRLYRQLQNGEPFPGCMSICLTCTHRDGVTCRSEHAKLNGGPGLDFTWEKEPMRAHLCGPRHGGGWKVFYSGPVRTCTGFDLIAPEADHGSHSTEQSKRNGD